MSDNTVALGLIGIIATLVGLCGLVIKYFITNFSKDLREHTRASTELKNAVISFDIYLRERNGRDGEIHSKLISEIQNIPSKISQDIATQHIDKQEIKRAVLKETVIDKGSKI